MALQEILTPERILEQEIQKALEQDEGIKAGDALLWDEDQALLLLSDLFSKRGQVIVVLGKKGAGKTAWAFWAGQKADEVFNRDVATLAFENTPFDVYYDIKSVPNDTFLIVDEAELMFHARRSHSRQNVKISQLASISRHKGLTLVFVTQASSFIDRNLLMLADFLILKEPSGLAVPLERYALIDLISYAKWYFALLAPEMRKRVFVTYSDELYNFLLKRYAHYVRYFSRSYVEAICRQFAIIRAINGLPEWWTEEISRAYANWDFGAEDYDTEFSTLPEEFTARDVMRILGIQKSAAYKRIQRWRRLRWVKREKNGIYVKIKS